MEKRRFMKDNKGYTLIEMIIVIAIIAIMTGAAMVTITILHNAKAKEASITLETALSETQKNAKGKMCVVADTQQPDYKFALAVYKSGSKYYVKKGYYIGNGNDMSLNSSYVFDDSENANSGKGESFSEITNIFMIWALMPRKVSTITVFTGARAVLPGMLMKSLYI